MFDKVEIKDDSEKLIDSNLDFNLVHQSAIIDLKQKPERPPLAISVGYDDVSYNGEYYPLRFGTYGNISMIKGEEKSRKTFLKSMVLACAIGGNANLYNSDIKGHLLEKKYIIDIDTEQDRYDNWLVGKRVPEMVGTKQEPFYYDYYVAVNLRQYTPKQRLGYLDWLFNESQYKDNLGVVSLDGFVDFLNDFNSQQESSEFTQKLMSCSTMAKCHILGLLHLNPNTEKARGHLGTILQQKCETVVIIQDKGDYSLVTCQRGRGKKFKPFGISVDNDWLPYKYDISGCDENWK